MEHYHETISHCKWIMNPSDITMMYCDETGNIVMGEWTIVMGQWIIFIGHQHNIVQQGNIVMMHSALRWASEPLRFNIGVFW